MSVRCAILGPTGYTGYWLIRLLQRHGSAALTYLASARDELPHIADEFPSLRDVCDMTCRPIDAAAIAAEADVAFLCLPHKAAMAHVPDLLDASVRVVDLSADYRLVDADLYEATYRTPHTDRENLAHAVYGLPEFYADRIRDARLVANPGCYPTAAALGITPLLRRGLIAADDIVINAASGVTGAGRGAKPHLQFAEVANAYAAYAAGDHRHQPEIEQTLADAAGRPVNALFVPHLLPIDRGILETIYLTPNEGVSEDDLYAAFEDAYDAAPFVRVRTDMPNVSYVRDTNYCDISVRLVEPAGGRRRAVVFAAEDNMIKGASGQAVQNMNLMFGLEETEGLA